MGKIVAIGGGNMGELETLPIDREILRLTKKKKPRALFIPTASSDSREYWEVFRGVYTGELNCHTDVLYLLGQRPTRKEITGKILSADLIYVGGGNTLKMMRRWRTLGVDRLLRRAHRKGTVLSGLSAGCICWFAYGHSDSMAFYHPDDWDYIRVKCLGLINGLGCPHYDGEKRDRSFETMVKKQSHMGIALDNNCALEVIDNRYRVLTSTETANAYRIYRERGKAITETIPKSRRLNPLKPLLTKPIRS